MQKPTVSQILNIYQDLELRSSEGRTHVLSKTELEKLGHSGFVRDHGLRFPYMAGSMAHGISSVALVKAMADKGMLGSFGAAGLSIEAVEKAIDELQRDLPGKTFAVNFIHSPQEIEMEDKLCDLLLRKKVGLVEASAFMGITKALVRYRCKNLRLDSEGRILCPQKIIAKVSRVELGKLFWSPAPLSILDSLLAEAAITQEEHRLAQLIPLAQDLTVEADSGGHTDNRPLVTLLPHMLLLKRDLEKLHSYPEELRVGAAGGISTPYSALAAFSMGASYIVTGSINQACIESGTSDEVRKMLAETGQSDFIMAPAADMFELGVKLQVLKRGTMFPMKAQKLYELYREHPSIESLNAKDRATLEANFFRCSLDEAWANTRIFFERRDRSQIVKAEANPKFKMALLFRSYLGQASHWAKRGDSSRRIDYQIWCGPAMAAFNDWARGSALEDRHERKAAIVGLNILFTTAVLLRIRHLNFMGMREAEWETLVKPLAEHEIIQLIEGQKIW